MSQPALLDIDKPIAAQLVDVLRVASRTARGAKLKRTTRAWAELLVDALGAKEND